MDITQLILDDHAEQRRLFAIIEQIDPKDTDALSAVWSRLSAFLDVHAEAEERFFYPELLKQGEGANDAEDDGHAQAHGPLAGHDGAGEEPDDRADDEPGDDQTDESHGETP